jgi:hypothetical protein
MGLPRSALLLVIAALAGCGGDGGEGSGPPPPAKDARARLASGKPLPAECVAAPARKGQVATFAAEGKIWAISLAGHEPTCLFPVQDPGPFDWGPRGDRVLLDGLRIEGLGDAPHRPADDVHPVSSSWGRPVGKAVVFVPPGGKGLLKARPGRSDYEDVTPVRNARYLEVVYHPSGLAFGIVLERKGRQELWLSSNTGRKPVRLVHGRLHTSFGPVTFSVDGRAIDFAAQHGDGTVHVHRIDLELPGSVDTVWMGEPGVLVYDIAPAWNTGSVALTIGPTCVERRAVYVDGDNANGRPLLPEQERPTRVVGWARNDTLLVAAGGCGGREDLYAVTLAGRTTKLVSGVDAVAVRRPEPLPPPPLPARGQVGSGFA